MKTKIARLDRSFPYDVCVIGGAGHVGLPLSIALANTGLNVAIYDVNRRAIESIQRGRMPFKEQGAEPLLRRVIHRELRLFSTPGIVSRAKILIIIIGTPVDEHLNPKYHLMKKFIERLFPYLRNRQILVLRSTIYPGTTEKIRTFLKRHNATLEVCFCPERIAEGKAIEELSSLPAIVSGFDPSTVSQIAQLFRRLNQDVVITRPLEAELAKLFTNSFRYIQFAIANQFYMVAEEYGADFYKIYDAMVRNYPRLHGFPKAGFAAGPCLLKDTMQISAFTSNKFFLGHSAMLVNEGMPNFIVASLKRQLPLHRKTVGILGMAFKADSDDYRESLSYKLRKILEIEANRVLCSDPYIKDPAFVDEQTLLRLSDIVVIGAPHRRYAELNFRKKRVVDIWNFIGLRNRS